MLPYDWFSPRGSGTGPFQDYRGAGTGPFYPKTGPGHEWLARALEGTGRTRRRRRRNRGGSLSGGLLKIREKMLDAWNRLKAKFVPLAMRHAKTLLQVGAKHAKENAGNYIQAFRQSGLPGVHETFVQSVPGIARTFVREVINPERGGAAANEACDLLTTLLELARPHLSKLLTVIPPEARSEVAKHARERLRGGSLTPSYDDTVMVAPFQALEDQVLRATAQQMNPTERGGFLPLLLGLVPLLSAAIGATPKIIELVQKKKDARGGLDPASLYDDPMFPRVHTQHSSARGGAGPSMTKVEVEEGTFSMTRRPDPLHTVKVTIKREGKGKGKGRPAQRTMYIPEGTLF